MSHYYQPFLLFFLPSWGLSAHVYLLGGWRIYIKRSQGGPRGRKGTLAVYTPIGWGKCGSKSYATFSANQILVSSNTNLSLKLRKRIISQLKNFPTVQCFGFSYAAAAAASLMECWFRLKGHSCASNSSCPLIYLLCTLIFFGQHFIWQNSSHVTRLVKELCDKLHLTTNMCRQNSGREKLIAAELSIGECLIRAEIWYNTTGHLSIWLK